MLSFFPTPYPDEVLYSVLARYHIRSGNLSPKVTLRDLFDTTNVISTIDFPSHLQILSNKLSHFEVYTFENFVKNHTLFRFYAPFISAEKSQTVLNLMRFNARGIIHTKTGIMASSVKTPTFIRFCPQCLKEDFVRYGESYWHRLHQIPVVPVCHKHFCLLSDSKISISQLNRHSFYPANEENCLPEIKIVPFPEKDFKVLIEISKDAEWLLSNDIKTEKNIDWRKRYESILIENNIATANGRVRQPDLINFFTSRYSLELLNFLDSPTNISSTANWLSNIVRKHRKAFHPIRHILFIRAFGYSLPEFFGESPVKTISPIKKRKRQFGNVWKNKLQELVSVQKHSLREIARQMKVTPRTINRYVQILGMSAYWQKKEYKKPVPKPLISPTSFEVLEKQRNLWNSYRKENPKLGKTELRKLIPGVYTWLYRNDRKWLNKNSPPIIKIVYENRRVDWEKRDLELLNESQIIYQQVLRQEPPVRVTQSRIGKGLNKKTLIDSHLTKLPQLKQYFEIIKESVEDFQKRRILWAIRKLDAENIELRIWRVVRLAGLKKEYAEKFESFIEQSIQTHYSQYYSRKVI